MASDASDRAANNLTTTLQRRLASVATFSLSALDRAVPPARRDDLQSSLSSFATARPHLAAFLLCQVLLSGPVVVAFIISTGTALAFALLAGVLVAGVAALLFVAATLAVVLVVVLPVLFFTTLAATGLFCTGVAVAVLVDWVRRSREQLGPRVGSVEGVKEKLGLESGASVPEQGEVRNGQLTPETSKKVETIANGNGYHDDDPPVSTKNS